MTDRAALERLVAAGPAIAERLPIIRSPQGQEPQNRTRKIDQLEPSGFGRRRYRGSVTPLRLLAEVGYGAIDMKAPRLVLHDRTDVSFLHLGLESAADSPRGAALHLRTMASGSDLFVGSLLSNGVVPRPAATQLFAAQAFPHLRFTAPVGDFEVPFRLGVSVDHTNLDHHRAGVEREWLTVGVRWQAEPSHVLHATRDGGLDLFARLGGQVGYGWFHEQYANGRDGDSVLHWDYDVGLGLRLRHRDWAFDLRYEFGQGQLGATDTGLFGGNARLESLHQGVFLGGSYRF
ncbi:MAG: hypothetical protein KDC98_09770 [Planctomycetes bacterium]|nr:hypothetical protein [Planctomycetota bacterium]